MGDSDKSEPHELFGRRGNKIIADRDEEITDHKEDIADRKEKEPVEAEKWNILGKYGIARIMEDSQNHDARKIANTRISPRPNAKTRTKISNTTTRAKIPDAKACRTDEHR